MVSLNHANVTVFLHCHGKRALFGVSTGERHPSDVEWMRERAEGLGPDDTKVTGAAIVDLRETTIEDIGKHGHAQTRNDRLTTFVVSVRDDAEQERDRNLCGSVSSPSI